jgi:hypothetical protein
VPGGEQHHRHDRGKRIPLEGADQLDTGRARGIGVDKEETGKAAKDDRPDLLGSREVKERELPLPGPATDQVRDRLPCRRVVEDRRASAQSGLLVVA